MKELVRLRLILSVNVILWLVVFAWLVPTFVLSTIRDQGAPTWVNTLLLGALVWYSAIVVGRVVRRHRTRVREMAAASGTKGL